MQVIEANNGLLTNIEVLDLLRERKQQRLQHQASFSTDRQKIDSQHRLAIENKTTQYFQKNKINEFPLSDLTEYLLSIKQGGFQLTENEIIQMVNLLPENDVEFYLVLENCSQRFTEDEINYFKQIVENLRVKKQQRMENQQNHEEVENSSTANEDIMITRTVKKVN